MWWWDPSYIIVLPAMAFALYAQSRVKSAFAQNSQVRARSGATGHRVARDILDRAGLNRVLVERVPGELSDHFDPRKEALRLSEPVHDSSSIAALGVAAHEAGHALQHGRGYWPLQVRNLVLPSAQFGSSAAFPLAIAGFFFNAPFLIDIGIFLFFGVVVFQVITLPVEFNASSRALVLLEEGGYLDGSELPKARAVLNAAALTYVAAMAVAVTQLIRLLVLRGRRN